MAPEIISPFTQTVQPEQAGERLDKFLASMIHGTSRVRIQEWIKAGQVTRGDVAVTDPAHKIKGGEAYTVRPLPTVLPSATAQAIPLEIVYEDDDLIVLNKPAGMVVHPAAGNPDKTLVNALLAHCAGRLAGVGGVLRPGIVHRLDKDTSGLLVAAKNDATHHSLALQFARRSIRRAYLAFVYGAPVPASGTIEGAIGRHPTNRKIMAVTEQGKAAITTYQTLASVAGVALLECRLQTGRTHQIRVHLTHRGHPLVGDKVYGRARAGAGVVAQTFPRQALHAYELGFHHPKQEGRLLFHAPLPDDLAALQQALGIPLTALPLVLQNLNSVRK